MGEEGWSCKIHPQQAGGCPEEQEASDDLGNVVGLGHVAETTPQLTEADGSHLQGFVGITRLSCRGNGEYETHELFICHFHPCTRVT